jgi:hypothetical protein
MSNPATTHTPPTIEHEQYWDHAREICRRVRHKDHLSDDEIIVLAVTAAQFALLRYVEPSKRDAAKTLDAILEILDHRELVAALMSKMDHLLQGQRTITRLNAPGISDLPNLRQPRDADEPAGDPFP